MARPTVTLCIIAKNEADFIGACLASALPAVDECVVCDTGSTDDTVALARAAGATVVFHDWADDFSAARNAALAAATGDFVLILDCDEQLLPDAPRVLATALATDAFDLGVLPLHHADALDAAPADVVSGSRRYQEATGLARLFRRTPDLRWEGRIHESPSTWMARPDLRMVTLPIHIVHYGNVPDLRAARDKSARNLALLEKHCAAHPTDHPRLAYLARERLRAGDRAGALDAATRSWTLAVQEMGHTGAPAACAPFCATMAGFLRLTGGDAAGCRTVMAEARAHHLDHPNIHLLDATAILELPGTTAPDAMDDAAAALEQSLGRASEVFVDELLPGATGATAARVLGQLRALQGDHPRARVALERALAEAPHDPHARLALAEVHVAANQPGPALARAEPLLATGVPDAWLIAARAAMAARQMGQVEMLLARARQSTVAWLDPKRRIDLARAEAELRAWKHLASLTGGRPPPPVTNPDALLELARGALASRQLGRAMQVLPTVLSTQPANVPAWCLMATACLQQGGHDLARAFLRTAADLSPHHPEVVGVRADLAGHLGNAAAQRTWQRLQGALSGQGFGSA